MEDQFPPDKHPAKADYEVSSEYGPGEGAAGFRAPRQEESLGGGGSEKPPEKGPLSSTETSRGFLDRIVKGIKKAVLMSTPGGAAVAIAFPESTRKTIEAQSKPESVQLTPTEASERFRREQAEEFKRRAAEGEVEPPTFFLFG